MTHRMITEAIANHDPIGAKAAMVMHLNFNRSYIKRSTTARTRMTAPSAWRRMSIDTQN